MNDCLMLGVYLSTAGVCWQLRQRSTRPVVKEYRSRLATGPLPSSGTCFGHKMPTESAALSTRSVPVTVIIKRVLVSRIVTVYIYRIWYVLFRVTGADWQIYCHVIYAEENTDRLVELDETRGFFIWLQKVFCNVFAVITFNLVHFYHTPVASWSVLLIMSCPPDIVGEGIILGLPFRRLFARWFVWTDIIYYINRTRGTQTITTISHELLEQSGWNLQGISNSPYWWPDYILEVKGQGHSRPSRWRRQVHDLVFS